jgi:hypothetical protein
MLPESEVLLARLAASRADLLALITPLAEATVRWQPADSSPSIVEQLQLLIAGERRYRQEALRLRYTDQATLDFTIAPAGPVESWPALCQQVERERRLTIFTLQELQPADRERHARHPTLGEVSMLWVFEQIWHAERRTLRAISDLLAQLPLTGGE